jgi:NAD(P)-dependent dehydrogenase (short-subunit alcohol dehydrogenase family)
MAQSPLLGKNVLVTGAGRGIGKRLAIGFASAGAQVGLFARSKPELDLTQLEIEHAGGKALRLRGDVRNREQVTAAIERMKAHFGPVQVLVHAAAVQGPIGPFSKASATELDAWWDTLETQMRGAVHACRAVLPDMIHARTGKIILISGRGGAEPWPNFSAYSSAKAALVRFSETLAEEVRDANVQVNALSPGGSYTSMTDEILAARNSISDTDYENALQVRVTGGVTADKQTELALFLASERSNHVSGKLIHVQDDWKKLERGTVNPQAFTVRRMLK